jgi:hypothetical protein
MNMNRVTFPGRQNGAALVVGLILMVVITVLAISGMNTATTEACAGPFQYAGQCEPGAERRLQRNCNVRYLL